MTREEFLFCWEKLGNPKQLRLVARGEAVQGKIVLPEDMPGIVIVETGITRAGDRYVAIASVDVIGGFKVF